MKAKTHAVTIGDRTYLVKAQTRAGAVRNVVDKLSAEMREQAHVDLASGEQIYEAGRRGDAIIGADRYVNNVDPDQRELLHDRLP